MAYSILKQKIKANKFLYYVVLVPYLPIRFLRYIKRKRLENSILENNRRTLNGIQIKPQDILYFGVPYHFNAGDMAQTYCTKRWMKSNYPNSCVHEFNTAALLNNDFLDEIKRRSFNSNIIFFQSGYTSHEKHYDHAMHKLVVQKFPDNKIVFLPQTVNISTEAELQRCARIFQHHKHLLFLVRDHISFEMVKDSFQDILLMEYPDIVTSLVGTEKYNIEHERNGVLICVRNDSEKLYGTKEIKRLINELQKVGQKVEITDTTLSGLAYSDFYNNFEAIFSKMLKQYHDSKLVITDRYHGTIFAAITNTPVIVLATNDHKVKGGVEWFADNGYKSVMYAESIEKAQNLAKSVLAQSVKVHNKDYFKVEYYDKLKSIIDTL